jgi:puromycin-sensitive aminopeptidase
VDGLHSTRPIEFPVHAPREADAMFDVLTYEKGASVLRMLEQYLGPDVFRQGVRDYLTKHRFDNADTGDLWAALGGAARQPIPAVMDGWIFKPGYPLVTVERDGAALVLRQQRFNYLREPLPPTTAQPAYRWQVPVQLRLSAGGRTTTERVLLTGAETRVALPAGFEAVVANEGGHGFYRVRYAGDLLERVLAGLERDLAPIERFNLVNDAWAVTVAGHMPIADYLDLTARFRGERDRNVWSILIGSFHSLNRVIDDADRPRLEALVRDRVAPAFEALGWTAGPGEDELTRQLRGDLIRALGALGNDRAVQQRAAAIYAAHLGDPTTVDPNVLPAVIAVLAHVGDERRYEEFLARFRAAATPQEEQRFLYALAAFQRPTLIAQTLERTINGDIRTQDAPFVARAMLMSVFARESAWEFIKKHWETMDRLYPKHGLRRMAEGVIGLARPEWEADVHRFFAERKIELGGKTLEQYLEQLRVAVTLGRRDGDALAKYLARIA